MWQVRAALLGEKKVRSAAKIPDAEQLPRRWTELILRLNDMERPTEQATKREPS